MEEDRLLEEAVRQLAEEWKHDGRDYHSVADQCSCDVDKAKFEAKGGAFAHCAGRLFDLLKG